MSHGKLAITMAKADYSQSHSSEIDFKVLIRCVVKGYQECIFKVETGDIFTAVKKIGDYGVHSRLLTASEVNLDIFKERLSQCSGP